MNNEIPAQQTSTATLKWNSASVGYLNNNTLWQLLQATFYNYVCIHININQIESKYS